MPDWLTTLPIWLDQQRDCVLITIAKVEGSTPREHGASMLVAKSTQQDNTPFEIEGTIGGGHLEWVATQTALIILADNQAAIHLERFSLGAKLGQCCGGVVWLLFEKIIATHVLTERWQHQVSQINQGKTLIRHTSNQDLTSVWHMQAASNLTTALIIDQDAAHWTFTEITQINPFHVLVFGAGHVGHALVNALLPLGATVQWVDTREHVFPVSPLPNVTYISTDDPTFEIVHAPAHAYFLILTHNHALDLELCLSVFKRNDYKYFGLIGSKSKRALFQHRFAARGIAESRFKDMTCPMGIQGIHSKEPTVVAVAIVAELLQIRFTDKVL